MNARVAVNEEGKSKRFFCLPFGGLDQDEPFPAQSRKSPETSTFARGLCGYNSQLTFSPRSTLYIPVRAVAAGITSAATVSPHGHRRISTTRRSNRLAMGLPMTWATARGGSLLNPPNSSLR